MIEAEGSHVGATRERVALLARTRLAQRSEDECGVTDIRRGTERAAALRDRRGAAVDRVQGTNDRRAASADRALAALDRVGSSIDLLTLAHRRDAGAIELGRELDRARCAGLRYVLAFIDLDGLKHTNDSRGHASGDERLRETADAIRSQIRSYDLLVRFGGEEFLCRLGEIPMAEAARRFAEINDRLLVLGHGSITVGLVEFRPGETLDQLVARADNARYAERAATPSA